MKDQINTSTIGLKFDSEKPRWDLLPLETLTPMVEVLTFGAQKYGPNNWKLVEKDRYVAAALRHFASWMGGELIDPESGKPHMAHLMCNILFISWIEQHEKSTESN
mgnify:CR=1 FL=1